MSDPEKTPDHDERLRATLASLVPEPPQSHERAARARSRHRRHRARLATGTTVAAVATVVAVPLAWQGLDLGASPGDPATVVTSPSDSAPPEDMGPLACAPPATDAPLPPLTGADTLPTGAVAVRMCHPGGVSFQAPADALTQDVDALVDLVNEAPVRPEDPNMACTMDLGPTWEFVFGYADGGTRTVRAERHGCGGIFVGDVTRNGDVTALVDGFNERLLAQRATSTPPSPAPTVELACEQGTFNADLPDSLLPIRVPLDLVDARLCWSPSGTWEQPEQAQIDAADLATLVEDLNAHAAPPTPEQTERSMEPCTKVPTDVRIVAATAWGDRITLHSWCGDFNLRGDSSLFWTPSPEGQEILDRLMS